jgi:hypothetical protein
MDFWQFIIFVLIPSGLIGALTSGILTYFSNKKLDIHQRTMEIRKDLYTKISNQIAFFFDTVSKKESDNARDDLLKYFREVQLWGSDEVVRNFKKLVYDMDLRNNISSEKRNMSYKNFIIAMRKDLLGKTNLHIEDIDIKGVVK